MLELLAFGLTNKEIAQRLSLSSRTVESHIDRVLGKLGAPTRIRAVVEAGRMGLLGAVTPGSPAGAPSAPPHNLPFQLTPLVGREQDAADVKHLLENNRLFTLTGAGGVGKTRLALRVGVDLLDRYSDGVWFCDFSAISDASLVANVAAKALRVRGPANRALTDSIVHALRPKAALLIFDNCEHVLEASAELADEILHNCANVHVLATSRQALGIIGEVVHRLPSLAVPETAFGLKADAAKHYGAVALFVDRARASDSGFVLTNENAPVVATICRRLDGIPLAIELAAARTNVLNLHSLAQSLDDRFKVLTAGGRTALPRHRTLAALVDWSYDRLSQAEQRLFERLGIFAGGFGLAAATAVCGDDVVDRTSILNLLIALVEKSLVVAQTHGEHERYRLLESTRAYALAKLESSGDRESLERKSAQYFCSLAQAFDQRYGTGSTTAWLASMELEIENYRMGLEWAFGSEGDVELGAALAGAMERLWALAALSSEARLWLDAAIDRLDEKKHPDIAARVWLAKARFLQGDPMRDSAERALQIYQSLGDVRGAAHALRTLSYSLLQMGRVDDANETIIRAIAAFRETGDRFGIASCLSLQGLSAYNRGDFALGREFYLQALQAFKALGDELSTANVLGNLAELEFADGRPEQALQSVTESLEITSRSKYATDLAIVHNNMTAYRIALGKLDEARESARQALRWAQPEQNAWNTAVALQHLALLGALAGDAERAARLLGYVNVQYKQLALEREATEVWCYDNLIAALQKRLGEERVQGFAEDGARWSQEAAIEEALRV